MLNGGHCVGAKQHGFSAIELLVTVAIVAILVAIAVPSMRDIMAKNELTGAHEELMQLLNKAKLLARAEGRLINIDITKATRQVRISINTVTYQTKILPASVEIDANAAYTFNPDGTVTGAGGVLLTSNTAPSTVKGRTVTVSGTGQISLSYST